MRKLSLRTVQKITEEYETLVLLVPFNVSEFTKEEYSRLVNALRDVGFLHLLQSLNNSFSRMGSRRSRI